MTDPALREREGRAHAGLDGLVLVDKEAGWTSHDVVARLRRVFGQRRVGHAGTLDPDATGLLLVGLGRCTRLLRFLTPLEKTYRAQIVFGTATTTLDAAGEITERAEMAVTPTEVANAASTLTGEIEQVPPMVSAVKVGGERLHHKARRGEEVPRPPRRVTVARFDVTPTEDPSVYDAEVVCSSGTYVRVLAADLGQALGGVAHLRRLRRMAVGPFVVHDAFAVSELSPAAALSPAEAVSHLERVVVGDEEGQLIARGLPLDRVHLGASGEGPWALLDASGELLAVYESTGSDRVTAAVVLAAR